MPDLAKASSITFVAILLCGCVSNQAVMDELAGKSTSDLCSEKNSLVLSYVSATQSVFSSSRLQKINVIDAILEDRGFRKTYCEAGF